MDGVGLGIAGGEERLVVGFAKCGSALGWTPQKKSAVPRR
jgi:hypothetical protein